MRIKIRQTIDPTNDAGANNIYAGVSTLDSNYKDLTTGPGPHRYFCVTSHPITASQGWQEFEGTITGSGDSNHKQFRPNTAFVRPMFIVNYNGGNGTVQIASVEFWDATDEINNKALISSESTTRATQDTALSNRINTVVTNVGKNTSSIQSEISSRTSADSALGKRIDTVNSSVGSNKALITSEQSARSNADSALGRRVDSVVSTAGKNTSAINSERSTRSSADTALGKRIDIVTSNVGKNLASIRSESSARSTADSSLGKRIDSVVATSGQNKASVQSEVKARSDADKALSARIDTITAKSNSNTVAIQKEASASASADSALGSRIDTIVSTVKNKADTSAVSAVASRITVAEANINGKASSSSVSALSTQVSGNTSKVQTNASSINGLKSQYTIKTQSTSHGKRFIAGIGLTADAANAVSEITFLADKLFFVPSGQVGNFNSETKYAPFQIIGNDTYIKSAFIRDGTIENAKIKDATISGAKIVDATIGSAKIKELSADKITAGFLSVDRLQVNSINGTKVMDGTITNSKIGNEIKSDNYVPGQVGWALTKTGGFDAAGGTFRGSISASVISGSVVEGGIVISSNTNFVAATTADRGHGVRFMYKPGVGFNSNGGITNPAAGTTPDCWGNRVYFASFNFTGGGTLNLNGVTMYQPLSRFRSTTGRANFALTTTLPGRNGRAHSVVRPHIIVYGSTDGILIADFYLPDIATRNYYGAFGAAGGGQPAYRAAHGTETSYHNVNGINFKVVRTYGFERYFDSSAGFNVVYQHWLSSITVTGTGDFNSSTHGHLRVRGAMDNATIDGVAGGSTTISMSGNTN